jgi:hypothetical protein
MKEKLMTTEITTESIDPRPILHTLPDPADLPLIQAAKSMMHCIDPKDRPPGPEVMMRELRAALAEFNPGGHFRTPDIRLAAQIAVLDSMFHIGIRRAVKTDRILVDVGSKENNYRHRYEDGELYLSESETRLALKVQDQCRRLIESLKTSDDKSKRTRIASRRFKMQEKNKKS